ncbi:single-stranded DNA-binding protein [Alteribacter populi]|uniref:single-stranded DNA-binding protein n=1 Tax=Alteribacter populi TaxID=2011011 RepID=UPI000BBA4194|nr:single-stranded DNA-binding protein [Alteribacter populi]
MGLRDQLKKREERREKAANGGINGGLPEGVTRYVRLSTELKGEGKPFVILRDPDLWYFYYVHEAGDFATRQTYIKKHTCLNSPRKAPETIEEAEEMFAKFEKPNPNVCISDKAKAKRGLYFMVPVFDPEYNEWRVLDFKEFHVSNLINDMDKTEKAARKFDKSYTMIGDVVVIRKSADGKSYTIESSDMEDDKAAKVKDDAAKVDQSEIDYEELANFREESDIIAILHEAHDDHVDKSVLPAVESAQPQDEATPIPSDADAPPEDDF